jgi:hypothetical protein
MEQVMPAIGQAVANAFKQLLSEKHLYQYTEVDLSCVSALAKTLHNDYALRASDPGSIGSDRGIPSLKSLISEGEEIAANLWTPNGFPLPTLSFSHDAFPLQFDLPTINTFCDDCNGRWPFNSVAKGSHLVQGEGQDESFYLGYQCQQCKGRPILFLVCREGWRLRLAGRYPLEVLPTPKVLPKSVSKYYGNAVIAHHAGQTLAGLFLLRVFIEQFWRTVPAVKELVALQPKATGDEQGDAYQSKLPQDFNSRFPSLKDIYGKLSAAIHSADENAALFDDSCVKIEKHFEARRLFEITN